MEQLISYKGESIIPIQYVASLAFNIPYKDCSKGYCWGDRISNYDFRFESYDLRITVFENFDVWAYSGYDQVTVFNQVKIFFFLLETGLVKTQNDKLI